MVVDEQGRALVSQGRCDERVSPASTFKIALSLMGFDSGILTSPNKPKLPFKKGYPAFLPEWKQATDPQHWMRYSVVWYSQNLAQTLGEGRIGAYMTKWNYGNRDTSGHIGADPSKGFWIGSSLKISPAEQVGFIRKLMLGNLSVKSTAIDYTRSIMDLGLQANGWRLYGKTGSATPRTGEGVKVPEQTFGWFVGWAEKGGEKVAFAKLIRSSKPETKSLGLLAKDQVIGAYFGQQSPL